MSDDYKVKPVVFDGGGPAKSVDFNYDAIDAYCFDVDQEALDAGKLLEGFKKAFDWIAQVPAGDFKGMAIRVQVVRCILLQKDQVKMANEIGVTKAAISQRMCDLRDFFGIRNPKAGLRSDETRKQFSEQCKARHLKKQTQS